MTSEKKIVILNGMRSADNHLAPMLVLLTAVLKKEFAAQITHFSLQDTEINHCIGCFNCWLKTPGKCFYNDAGEDILQAIIQSDMVVLFTPIVFGGYSSELKKIIDRFLPLLLPFFKKFHGETHHPFRYPHFPRLIGIGVPLRSSENQLECFKMLIGRNAANLHPPSYAADVINPAMSSEEISAQLHSLIYRKDPLPDSERMMSLMHSMTPDPIKIVAKNRRATLLVGSPKRSKPSTSAELGGSLMKKMKRYGWNTKTLTLNHGLVNEQAQLLSSLDKSDVIVIAFPLYTDTLPFLVTKAFEVLAQQKKKHLKPSQPKHLVVLINSGFPEAHQSALALALCRNFAIESNMIWAGGLVMGAGEALLSGNRITGFKGYKSIIRPPLYYLNKALDLTTTALSNGQPVPDQAMRSFARRPIKIISFNLWRIIYIKLVKMIAENEAVKNGLHKQALHNKPYSQHDTSSHV